MKLLLLAVAILITGCELRGSSLSKEEMDKYQEVCINNGGLEKYYLFVDNGKSKVNYIKCKDSAEFYYFTAPNVVK